jgi:hypothetical protein
MKHMKKLTNQRHGLNKQGKVEDGVVIFTDDSGKVRERIIFGEV